MHAFLSFLENMAFSQWVKNAPTIWAFPTILIVHTLGMSIVAGVSAMISLVVLGFWPAVPIKPFARAFPLLWFGFGINAVTGTMMLVADATTKLTTLDFYLKMAFVFAGLYVLILMRRQIFDDPQARSGAGVGQRKGAGVGIAGVLVWRNYLRALAGVREVDGIAENESDTAAEQTSRSLTNVRVSSPTGLPGRLGVTSTERPLHATVFLLDAPKSARRRFAEDDHQ